MAAKVFSSVVFLQLAQLLNSNAQIIWDSTAIAHVSGNVDGLSHANDNQHGPRYTPSTYRFNHGPHNNRLKNTSHFKHTGANTSLMTVSPSTKLRSKPMRFNFQKFKSHLGVPVSDYQNCGVTTTGTHNEHYATSAFRVVGGRRAQSQAWPWMAAVGHLRKGNHLIDFHCGGSLVSERHVITAAHCILFPLYKAYLVRLGVENLHDAGSALDVRVAKTIAHGYFDWKTGANDIGVIFLVKNLIFNARIRPICLPDWDVLPVSHFNNYPFVLGWGLTKDRKPSSWLQEVSIPLVPLEECKRIYLQLPPDRIIHVRNGQICGGYKEGGRDACQGDSGGPMMISSGFHSRGSVFYLIGIISQGDGCAQPGIPGVFTDVAYYMPWLERAMNSTSSGVLYK